MNALDTYRKAMRAQAQRALNQAEDQPRFSPLQQQASEDLKEFILKLPMILLPDAQDLDPASDDYGKVYFIAGVHEPGDPDYPIGPVS